MIWLWTMWVILTYAELAKAKATKGPFDESIFLLNPSSHILSVTWTGPNSADNDRSAGCGQITVYEKFIGPEKTMTPGAGDFYKCSYSVDGGLDSLKLQIDITSFEVKQFRTYRVCVETSGGQACTRKFSIETAIPHRRKKKKDPFVESTFYLDSYSHQLSLELIRKTAGVQGKCVQLDVLEKFIGPEKVLKPSHEESYTCEYTSEDGMDHLTASVDISSYKVQQFRSYTVCVKVEEGGGVEKTCTRSFSVETIVPYRAKKNNNGKNNNNNQTPHDGILTSDAATKSIADDGEESDTPIPYMLEEIMNIPKDLERKTAFSFEENLEKDISHGIGLQKDLVNTLENIDHSFNNSKHNNANSNEFKFDSVMPYESKERKAIVDKGFEMEDVIEENGIEKDTAADKKGFEEDAIIVEKSTQSYGVEQIKYNFGETGNKFRKLENQFKDESGEVDNVDVIDKVEESGQQFDEPADMPDDSITIDFSDQSSAQASIANVYIVLIITFLCWQTLCS